MKTKLFIICLAAIMLTGCASAAAENDSQQETESRVYRFIDTSVYYESQEEYLASDFCTMVREMGCIPQIITYDTERYTMTGMYTSAHFVCWEFKDTQLETNVVFELNYDCYQESAEDFIYGRVDSYHIDEHEIHGETYEVYTEICDGMVFCQYITEFGGRCNVLVHSDLETEETCLEILNNMTLMPEGSPIPTETSTETPTEPPTESPTTDPANLVEFPFEGEPDTSLHFDSVEDFLASDKYKNDIEGQGLTLYVPEYTDEETTIDGVHSDIYGTYYICGAKGTETGRTMSVSVKFKDNSTTKEDFEQGIYLEADNTFVTLEKDGTEYGVYIRDVGIDTPNYNMQYSFTEGMTVFVGGGWQTKEDAIAAFDTFRMVPYA